jgi:uncharacterized membrane protein YbaN (DUF454 family)
VEPYVTTTNRILLIACGTISVALGVLGVLLPLLPTTPFLLLAAACYARSSEQLYDWLLGNRWFGRYIRNYREGKGIPLKRAAVAIALLWLTIGYTAIVAVSLWWVRLILVAIAGGVTVHLVRGRRTHSWKDVTAERNRLDADVAGTEPATLPRRPWRGTSAR